jgi:sigma-B regulation protein RsbU (phosphoserine phosphatase)
LLFHSRQPEAPLERLTTGGTPIGLLPGRLYDQGAIRLESGDVLLCFSDGISEATNEAGDFWKESEIEELLRSSGESSADELTRELVARADAFAGTAEQADDMTVVTLRVL